MNEGSTHARPENGEAEAGGDPRVVPFESNPVIGGDELNAVLDGFPLPSAEELDALLGLQLSDEEVKIMVDLTPEQVRSLKIKLFGLKLELARMCDANKVI